MKQILLLFLSLTFSQYLLAQTFRQISINTGFSGTQGKLIVADLDNDGDPDGLLASLDNSGLAVFKNNNGTFARSSYPEYSFNASVFSIDAGDINRDGFIDILLGGRNYSAASQHLLLNNGTTLTAADNQRVTSAATNGKIYLGDFEGDGDLDAVCAGTNGIILNRNNTFSGSGPYFPKSGTWYAHWWNLDNDTELEVIQMWGSPGSGWVGGTHFLERNSPVMSVSTQLSYDAILIQDPIVADFDGDGDLDMLNKKLGNSANNVRIYKNDNGKFVDSGIAFPWGESIEFADINNDGLYDVIVGGTMTSTWMVFETAIYINQNDGTFAKLNAGIPSSENSHARVADFDGDGDLDLLTMSGAFQNNSTVVNAPPSAPAPLTALVSGSSVKLQWQPGSDDKTPVKCLTYNIAVRSEDGTIVVPAHALPGGKRTLYKVGNAWNNLSFDLSCLKEGKYFWKVQTLDASYQGSAFSQEQSFSIEKAPPGTPANVTATPVADNAIDIHWVDLSSTEDEFIIFRSGPYDRTTFNVIDTVTADMTSYRDTLYLLPESTYQYRIVASNCAYPDDFAAITDPVTTFPRAFVVSGWLDLGEKITGSLALLGDIDRDEDLDLVISYDGAPYTKLFRFNGMAYEDSGIEFALKATFGQWIDYNADGYIDLLLSGNGSSKLYRNDKGDTFTVVDNPTFPLTFTQLGGISVGDYDNDGDDDLALMNDSRISLYDNDGRGKFTKNTAIQLDGHLKSTNAWADYDNDGDLDLLGNMEVSCSSNIIVIHENTSNNVFLTKEFSSLQGSNDDSWNFTGDMEWGDYDNDGYPDIMVAGQNTCGNGYSINRIYRNNKDKTFSHASNLVQLNYDVNVDWGDYDNDGDLDVFAYGDPFGAYSERTRIYRNEGTKFRETNIDYLLKSTQYGKSVRGDIDNDGDLDYVILGEVNYTTPKIIAYRNTYAESWGLANHRPSAPNSINSHVADDQSVTLSWAEGEDLETQQNGLTYNLYLVREGHEAIPEADSLIVNSYSTESGSRMIVSAGNVNGTTIRLKNLEAGTYRWAVQSIDKGFAGSAFSSENSFVIAPIPPIVGVDNELCSIVSMYPNPTENILTVVSRSPQYSLQLRLSNALGQAVTSIALVQSTTTYDMSFLPAGLYVASIYRNGIRVGLQKILKK
jgi:hypothetical protein